MSVWILPRSRQCERHASSPTPKMAMRIVRWRIYHSISFYRTPIMLDIIDLALQSLAQVSDAAPDGASMATSAASTAGSAADPAAASGAIDAAGQGTVALPPADMSSSGTGTTGVTAPGGGLALGAGTEKAPGFLHFIAQSDIVGKSLFGVLIVMSLISWYLIIVKMIMR